MASISLPKVTFQTQSNTGVKASILVLRKKTPEERQRDAAQDREHAIFMAVLDEVGYDSRANTVYQRTPEGELVKCDGAPLVQNELPLALAHYWRFWNDRRIVPLRP